jgi:threonine-phosphate decarboxylase
VRDCSDFAGIEEDYIRVAVKTHQENLLLLDALENSDR